MNKIVLGKCSICGGIVSMPTIWFGILPPIAACESCFAIEDKYSDLPTVPMTPLPINDWRYRVNDKTSWGCENISSPKVNVYWA